MTERRRTKRQDKKERRHPLRALARLRPAGPALDRRKVPRDETGRLTVRLPLRLLARLRSAVFYTPGMTVTALVEGSIEDRIDQLEIERGAKFRGRKQQLRAGRPKLSK